MPLSSAKSICRKSPTLWETGRRVNWHFSFRLGSGTMTCGNPLIYFTVTSASGKQKRKGLNIGLENVIHHQYGHRCMLTHFPSINAVEYIFFHCSVNQYDLNMEGELRIPFILAWNHQSCSFHKWFGHNFQLAIVAPHQRPHSTFNDLNRLCDWAMEFSLCQLHIYIWLITKAPHTNKCIHTATRNESIRI